MGVVSATAELLLFSRVPVLWMARVRVPYLIRWIFVFEIEFLLGLRAEFQAFSTDGMFEEGEASFGSN